MHQNIKFVCGLVAICLGTATFGGAAYARSAGGAIGHASTPSDATCFPYGGGATQNVCGSARFFDLPLPVDSSGSKNISIDVGVPLSGAFSCTSYSENQTATTFFASATITAGSTGSVFLFNSGSINYYNLPMSVGVPSNGYLLAICQVPASGFVLGSVWTS